MITLVVTSAIRKKQKTVESLNPNCFKLTTVRRLGILLTKVILLCLALLLPGCSTIGTHLDLMAGNAQAVCRALYQEVNAAIDRAGMRDYGFSTE